MSPENLCKRCDVQKLLALPYAIPHRVSLSFFSPFLGFLRIQLQQETSGYNVWDHYDSKKIASD